MDDLISRQAAIDEIKEIYEWHDNVTKERIIEHFERLPSAERRGRWIDIEHAPNGLLYATCSACGKRQTIESVNYCGNCGAKMVEK